MPPHPRVNAVAFISPQNRPILIRVFSGEDEIKYHYIAHTSLDIFEERLAAGTKSSDCYLGLLYTMEGVAVYGYITPLKVKLVLSIVLSDSFVKDTEVISIFKALHVAYYQARSNPFLKIDMSSESASDHSSSLILSKPMWKSFRRRVDEVSIAAGTTPAVTAVEKS